MKWADNARVAKAPISESKNERRRLRRPAHLRYAIADSIALLDQNAWTKIANTHSFFMSPLYLATMEPVLNKLIKRLLLGIEHNDAPERNPFKKSA